MIPGTRFGRHAWLVNPPGTRSGAFTVPDHDLIWFISGDISMACDGVEHRIAAPALVLLHPDMVLDIVWDPLRPSRNFFCHFTPGGRLADLIAGRAWPFMLPLPDGDVLRPLLEHLGWLLEARTPGWEGMGEEALHLILTGFHHGRILTVASRSARLSRLGEAVVAHVAGRWTRAGSCEPILLGELAGAVGVSAAYLCRRFRAEFGCGPVEALRGTRLDRAAHLLAQGAGRIGEVAARCGFDDPFHFSRSFRSFYGCSPRAFAHHRQGADWPEAGEPGIRTLRRRLWEEVGWWMMREPRGRSASRRTHQDP
jgi:AraC-like DNA-binding protein